MPASGVGDGPRSRIGLGAAGTDGHHRRGAPADRARQHPRQRASGRRGARRRRGCRAAAATETRRFSSRCGRTAAARVSLRLPIAASASDPRTCRRSSSPTSRPAGPAPARLADCKEHHRGPRRDPGRPEQPRRDDHRHRAARRRPPDARPCHEHHGSILLVDDEEKILKTLGRALRTEGHRVVESANATRGEAAARRRRSTC